MHSDYWPLGSVQSPDTAELSYPAEPGPAGTPPPIADALPPVPRKPKLPFVLANAPWHSPLELAVPELYWFVPAAATIPAIMAIAIKVIPIAIVLLILSPA